jgi:RNA polymerase sigma-70 factor (ECF subfamily)
MTTTTANHAWAEMRQQLQPFVARRVGAADVDDVLQEILVRVQRGVAGVRDEHRVGAWMYQVARHVIVDHHRRRSRQPTAHAAPIDDDDIASNLVDVGAVGDDSDAPPELLSCVAPFIAQLPSPYREALTLTELQGVSQKEAAAMVGVSVSGMKSRVQRGRAQLRAAFEACCEIACDARGHVVDVVPRDGACPPIEASSVTVSTSSPACCTTTPRDPV